MAFLDNSGDIILDAVLTDTGRKRLAAGDGSFRIAKFALGDDEIDYNLYNLTHPSGSAFYDLNILQSPVLEAFTNNTSLLKSKLISFARGDLLYLPVIKLNNKKFPTIDLASGISDTDIPGGGYILTADHATSNVNNSSYTANSLLTQADADGVVRGRAPFANVSRPIIVDQGLDTPDLSAGKLANGDPLKETQYLVEVDYRFVRVSTPAAPGTEASPSFIDDDDIATYYFSLNSNSEYFASPDGSAPKDIPSYQLDNNNEENADKLSVIGNASTTGRYGTRFAVQLLASDDVATSNTLFSKLGGTTGSDYLGSGAQFRFIDTVIRITGFTTGYRVDVPLRLIKKI
jgi:hypothetical protein